MTESTKVKDTDLAFWLDAAREAAQDAATFIRDQSLTRKDLVWVEKSAIDFATAVDVGAEERIRTCLSRRIPEIHIVGEELDPTGDTQKGLVAIVDPLDGTTNFLHGYPAYCVSIGIVLDGVPVAGVIHDVAREGVFTATAGGGAFCDGKPIHVSVNSNPARALIGTGFPFKTLDDTEQYIAQFRALIPQVSGMRRAGAAALDFCDVACGRLDAFWELDLAAWDLAAGTLLVREAGGIVTNVKGVRAPMSRGQIVAGSASLHPWFLEVLDRAYPRDVEERR